MKNQILIGLGLGTILLAITNPPLEDHKDEVKQMVTKSMGLEDTAKEMAAGGDSFEKAGMAIGTTLGLALADKMIDAAVTRDNYVLFSMTKGTWEGEGNTIGMGVLGNVFLFKDLNDKKQQDEDVMRELNKVKATSNF